MDRTEYAAFLEDLVSNLESDDRVIGVVGLGSTAGTRPPDEWSDHDIWVVTRPGDAGWFRTHREWLPGHEGIVVFFRETQHGVGVLYDSGHLVEFAAFDPDELCATRVNDYAVLLDRERIGERMQEIRRATRASVDVDPGALAGRLLTALVVGVGRHRRGERLSGREFVCGVAAGQLVRLAAAVGEPVEAVGDDLDPRRRVERAHPALAARIETALLAPTDHAASLLLDASLSLLAAAGTGDAAIAAVRRVLDGGPAIGE